MTGIFELGLEDYGWQTDNGEFVDELTRLCEKLRSSFGNRRACSKVDKEISSLLSKRFGVGFRLLAGDYDYAVLPTYVEADSVLGTVDSEEISDLLSALDNGELDHDGLIKNFAENIDKVHRFMEKNQLRVDMQKAYVENFPKNVNVNILYNWHGGHFGKDITGRQIAAIFLHEVGHEMTYIANLANTARFNRVMANVLKTARKDKVDTKTLAIKISKDMSKEEAAKYLEETDSSNVIVWTIENYKYFSSRATEIVEGHYDLNSSEQLADSFASKFGLAYELAEALEKVSVPRSGLSDYAKYTILTFLGTWIPLVVNFLIVALINGLSITTVVKTTLIIFPIFIVTAYVLSHIVGIDGGNMTTYDDRINRVKRLKREIIMSLKGADLTKKQKEKAIKEIDLIEKWIRASKFHDRMLWETMADFISPTNARLNKDAAWNQFMEEMANNNLTARHTQLEMMAS